MRSAIFALALSLGLVACQTTSYVGDESSPFYVVPVGSRIILNKPLTVPPGQGGVYVQDGQVVTPGYGGQLRAYYPHCKFEVNKPMSSPQAINPDEFMITRVSREWAAAVDSGMVQYAALGVNRLEPVAARGGGARRTASSSDRDGGRNLRAFATIMDLGSDKQPSVRRLVCAQWGIPYEERHVTIQEIRHALGDFAALRLAETPR